MQTWRLERLFVGDGGLGGAPGAAFGNSGKDQSDAVSDAHIDAVNDEELLLEKPLFLLRCVVRGGTRELRAKQAR